MSVGQVAGNQIRDLHGNGNFRKIDRGRVEHTADGNRHVLLANVGFFEDELEETRALFLLLSQQLLDLFGREQAIFDERVGDPFTKCFNGRHGWDYLKALRTFLTSSVGETTYQSR